MGGRIREATGAVMLALVVGLAFEPVGTFRLFDLRNLEAWLQDMVSSAPAGTREHTSVALVGIDERSLEKLGRWPWDWDVHARIVRELTRLGARSIVYDVVFLPARGDCPGGREEFVQALRESGRVVLSRGVDPDPRGGAGTLLEPDPGLAAAAAGVAAVTMPLDPDGYVRRFETHHETSVTLDLLAAARHLGAEPPAADPARTMLVLETPLGARRVPLTGTGGSGWIRFQGPPGVFPTFSCTDLLEGRVPEEKIRQRTVLIGYTATALQDLYPVPETRRSARRMPGVEIHAHAIGMLLAGKGLAPAPPLADAALRYGALLAIAVSLVFAGPTLTALALVLLLLGIHTAVAAAFAQGVRLELARPMVLPLVAFVVIQAREYHRSRRKAREIRHMFSHYLNASVVELLVRQPERLRLGGESCDLTILFSDVRGFTTLSEALGPVKLVQVLNEYLTRMTDLVFEQEGTLDKYIGDALMAFFGAPIEQPDHPARACRSALAMMASLEGLNQELAATGAPRLAIGIGINTGPVVVGNMGSRMRFDYTVMGDAVNLASRLEGLTKQYGVDILLGELTVRALGPGFVLREIDQVKVKGKTEPVIIHQLVGLEGKVPEKTLTVIDLGRQALAAYRRQDWTGARTRFEAILDLDHQDGPARLFLERITAFASDPPPANWDGVFTAKTK